ncbi:MAG: hypothetical protein EX271_00250 [Acidimicrobiales bacterium]|nr:hypothetical protein [Hyphomonadaceae bacterium]RZV45013.1 MAG: hypothetical protein EX271_00250 [Acidimicrobiales bacterium]
MTFFKKSLAVLPLAAALSFMPAYAAHPEQAKTPSPQIAAETLDDLEFTDREIRIIRQQIAAAQKRADRAHAKTPTKSLKQQLDEIELPTEADIKEMQAQMPDLNALIMGMMKLAADDDMIKGMAKSADQLKSKLDFEGFETKDGMPDLNAMMSTMIALMGDEELVVGMIDAIEPIAELMEDTAADLEKKRALKD